MSVLDNMMLAAQQQSGESMFRGLVREWTRAGARRPEHAPSRCSTQLQHAAHEGRVRRRAVGRSAQAARDGAVDDGRAPQLIMLDEPMAGVNPALTQSLLGHVKRLRSEGITVMFVEHDMDVVRDISDWVVVMAEGVIIAEGPPDAIGSNQAVSTPTSARRTPRSPRRSIGTASSPKAARGAGARGAEIELPTRTDADRHEGARRCLTPTATLLGPRRQRRRRLRPRGQHPQRQPASSWARGADRHHRAERRRQVDDAEGAVRPDPGPRGHGVVPTATTSPVRRPTSLVARGIGYVPQINNVFPSLTVQREPRDGRLPAQGRAAGAHRTGSCRMFPRLGERIGQRAGSLSGGERQMLAMGRALMMEPEGAAARRAVSAGLSPLLQDQVFERVEQVNDAGVSIIMVEQNAARCLQICDRGLRARPGPQRLHRHRARS